MGSNRYSGLLCNIKCIKADHQRLEKSRAVKPKTVHSNVPQEIVLLGKKGLQRLHPYLIKK